MGGKGSGHRSKPRQKSLTQIREADRERRLEEERARAAKAAAILEGHEARKRARAISSATIRNENIDRILDKFKP